MAERLKASGLVGELAAEFAGTMILILFGCGVVAQVIATGVGDFRSIHWAWGLGVVFGVYVAGRISGAHLNPAVTVALAVFKGFPWRKVGPYSLAQFLGGAIRVTLGSPYRPRFIARGSRSARYSASRRATASSSLRIASRADRARSRFFR